MLTPNHLEDYNERWDDEYGSCSSEVHGRSETGNYR